jgi:Leucine-rich repeat (LRR) protein
MSLQVNSGLHNDTLRASLGFDPNMRYSLVCKKWKTIIIESAKQELAKIQAGEEDNLLKRSFREACRLPNGTQLDPTQDAQIPRCIAVFHAFQMQHIPNPLDRRDILERFPAGTFNYVSFLNKERFVVGVIFQRSVPLIRFSAEFIHELILQHLGNDDLTVARIEAEQREFQRLASALPMDNIIPLQTNTPRQIDQQQEVLDYNQAIAIRDDLSHGIPRYENIASRGLEYLGSEIGCVALRDLENLQLEHGQLSILPREMAHLEKCHTVSLRNNAFTRVPEVLSEMPALTDIDLSGNPIRVLPDDATFRRVWKCWSNHWEHEKETLLRALGFYGNGERQSTSSLSFGLSTETLTDMPFSLWFKDKFSVPYARVGFITQLTERLTSWLIRSDWHWGAKGLAMIPVALFVLAVLIIFAVVNLPILLVNLLNMSVVEPLVSFIRHHLGYSSMVHVRDILEGPAPAPQDWVDPLAEEQPAPADIVLPDAEVQ